MTYPADEVYSRYVTVKNSNQIRVIGFDLGVITIDNHLCLLKRALCV